MEFKALKNIETAYQQLRRYSMAFLGLCALITVVAVWRSYSYAEKQRQKIYVDVYKRQPYECRPLSGGFESRTVWSRRT